jgi:hypothetical protein
MRVDCATTSHEVEDGECPWCTIERLNRWVADLQSDMYVNCVYCGHRYGPGETTPVSMADALKEHIEQCPQHPMSALKHDVSRYMAIANEHATENERLRAALAKISWMVGPATTDQAAREAACDALPHRIREVIRGLNSPVETACRYCGGPHCDLECPNVSIPPTERKPSAEHVCGLQGFGRGIGSEDDVCPACSPRTWFCRCGAANKDAWCSNCGLTAEESDEAERRYHKGD